MEVSDAKLMKADLEEKIMTLLSEFQDRTGTVVSEVSLETTAFICLDTIKQRRVICGVTVEVQL